MSRNVPKKTTTNQKKAIRALLEYKTVEQAAEAIGVNRKTVHRWLDRADFRLELSKAEGRSLDHITRRLLILGDQAVDAIENVMNDPDQDGATNKRLSAGLILDQLLRLRELRNIETRLSDLEAEVFNAK